MLKSKIFISYFKPSYLFENDIIVPINVNSSESKLRIESLEFRNSASFKYKISKEQALKDLQWLESNTIKDDKNNKLNNLGWLFAEFPMFNFLLENYDDVVGDDVDVIGIMQYRKILNLLTPMNNIVINDKIFNTPVRVLHHEYKCGLNKETINTIFSNIDVATVPKIKCNPIVSLLSLNEKYRIHYIKDIHPIFNQMFNERKDDDSFFDIEKWNVFIMNPYHYWYNIFVCKSVIYKTYFKKIIDFVFDFYAIHNEKFIKKILTNKNHDYRFYGYLLENMVAYIFFYLENYTNYKLQSFDINIFNEL